MPVEKIQDEVGFGFGHFLIVAAVYDRRISLRFPVGNPNGVVSTQPRVGPGLAGPTLGQQKIGPTLKGLKQKGHRISLRVLQPLQGWGHKKTYPR